MHARLSSGRPVRRVQIGPLDAHQQEALADLLGLARLPGEQTMVDVDKLDSLLRETLGAGLTEVVVQLIGPIGDRAGERKQHDSARAELWSWLSSEPVVQAQPALTEWVAAIRRTGLIEGSVMRTRAELTKVLLVLRQLPASGIPLPVFAESVLGDPHALDEDQRCSGLVLKALAAIYQAEPPADAQKRRTLWQQAGIADDELSSTVLAAGFRPAGDDPVSRVLRYCAEAGHAAALTLQQVRYAADLLDPPQSVWLVENPSVLAMALARFDSRCPAMICTSGWPSSAGVLLLTTLARKGSTLHYHGDFDGEGLRIAANVMARTGAVPWRMSSDDYLAAVADGPPVGRITPAPWDKDLSIQLDRIGKTLSEERVATGLLDELATRLDGRALCDHAQQ
ncbi:TIGR02679 family protein [Kribbella orskensis]|uniref:TIGR02679 family protein n=1 Tax=Kribbella orskensis TaxID=2512216 RepID=UPI001052B007|nr:MULTISPECIES: TIGR02679 family protein [Kribbella]